MKEIEIRNAATNTNENVCGMDELVAGLLEGT